MALGQQVWAAGEPWYASGTFWTIAAVVVAVIAIVVGAWAAFRSARPRRALYITVDQAVSLLRAAPGLDGSGVAVSLHGRELTRPYVVTVDVVSNSALDIAPSAFGGSPLELEFGVPVLALLDQESDAGRPAVREPKVEVASTALHVSPALLTRRHRLRYSVLVDGKPDFRPVGDLVDVAVHVGPVPARTPLALRLVTSALLAPAVVLSAVGVVDIATGTPPDQGRFNLQVVLISVAAVLVVITKLVSARSR
ncbi:hypothetical protein [Saccharothrix syringae]|uniref:Uncharacterized protein n=2 Tax=Saccharothrix syringae TaxID=103733 RepID=A0A5Q0GU26_SACSY|nr:hypothetical protein [Saccharothrix syringae]QFZ17567.1 hypothetical protein EKG83_08795 [Saccharothrix syringae]